MTNYIKRLVYVDDNNTKINALIWPFLFCVTMYGIGFTLFPQFSWVNSSSLFQSFFMVHDWLPRIWGIGAVLAGGSAISMMLLRKPFLGGTAAMLGFLVWLFAGILYISNGYILVFLTVSVPNMYFWVFYYFRLKWYIRQRDYGRLVDPE